MLARSMPASGPDRLTTTAGGSSVTARRASRSWSLSLVLSAVCAASCGSPPPTTIASESFWPWNATACANGPRDAPRPKSVPSLGNECSEISDAVMCQREWAPAGLNPARSAPSRLALLREQLVDGPCLIVGARLDPAAVRRQHGHAGRRPAQQLLGQPHRRGRVASEEIGLKGRLEPRGGRLPRGDLDARQPRRPDPRRRTRDVDARDDGVERKPLRRPRDEHLAPDRALENVE